MSFLLGKIINIVREYGYYIIIVIIVVKCRVGGGSGRFGS